MPLHIKPNVQRERIKPDNEDHWLKLRMQDVTSTEISALFGISPYLTEFELWHRKKEQQIVRLSDNERMAWGKRLESAIAQGVAEEEELKIIPFKDYVRLPEHRLGSSFDFEILEPEHKLLEIKNVDGLVFRDNWKEDEEGNPEAPLHMEIQFQQEMLVAGVDKLSLRALIGGNKIHRIERNASPEIHAKILEKVAAFWKSIDENRPPSPDFVRDSDFICELYATTTKGLVANVEQDEKIIKLAAEYAQAGKEFKDAEARKKAIKAEIFMLLPKADKAVGPNFSLTLGYIQPTVVPSYERAGYRNFRLNMKKEKTA